MGRHETTPRHPEHKPRGDRHNTPPAETDKPRASGPGMTEVRTSDPNIVSPEPTPQPDRAVTYQTSQLSGSAAAYPFGSAGGVEQRSSVNGKKEHGHEDDERRQREHKPHEKKHDHKKHGEGQSREEDHHRRRHKKHESQRVRAKLPSWPALLMMCVLALACGVGGAWGYSALFGASQSDHQGKDGQGQKGGKSGGSESDQGSNGDDLKKQVEQLADGIDQLGTRIDRLNQATQEARMPVPQYYPGSSRIERMAPASEGSAPIPTALQTQLTVLERKVEQMEDLPGRVQELERRATEVQEEIKLLLEARAVSGSGGE